MSLSYRHYILRGISFSHASAWDQLSKHYLFQEALPPLLTYLLLPLALLQGTYLVPGQVSEDPTRGALAVPAPAAAAIRAQGAQVAIVETVQLRRQTVVSCQGVLARVYARSSSSSYQQCYVHHSGIFFEVDLPNQQECSRCGSQVVDHSMPRV